MIISVRFNKHPYISLIYEDNEWEEVEGMLQKIGLTRRKIRNLWGKRIQAEAYVESSEELRNLVQRTFSEKIHSYIDELNLPPMDCGQINLGIFRVIPTENEVRIPLDKFLTVEDLNRFSQAVRDVFTVILNLAVDEEIIVKMGG